MCRQCATLSLELLSNRLGGLVA
eukprot:COSAG01_NODE_39606_length_468_cov_1.237333_1_plen_22_part_01